MIIGKTYSNIGWEIENQYEILSQMIDDIAKHYQDEALAVQKEVDEIYNKYSDSDYETFSNETQGLDEVLEKPYSLCFEARKILFCAIFSYFETMLYGLILFYKIPIGGTNQIGQLIDKIKKEYDNRYGGCMLISESARQTICDCYRPLRNYYMHGSLNSSNDRTLLQTYAKSEGCINDGLGGHYEIKDNVFLRETLGITKDFLVSIDETYGDKAREFCKLNTICND